MLIGKRINILRYVLLTALLFLALLCFSAWTFKQILALFICFTGISMGFFLLVYGVIGLTETQALEDGESKNESKKKRQRFMGALILKFPLVGAALIGSVHLMDDLVFLPLLAYMGQMIVLFVCLQKGAAKSL